MLIPYDPNNFKAQTNRFKESPKAQSRILGTMIFIIRGLGFITIYIIMITIMMIAFVLICLGFRRCLHSRGLQSCVGCQFGVEV